MQAEQIATFIALVELDQRLIQISKELEEGAKQKAFLQEKLDEIDHEVDLAKQSVRGMKKNIDSLDLEIRTVDGQEARVKEKLLTAGSPKELISLEAEKKNLEKKRVAFDEQGLELLLELEQAQKKEADIVAAHPDKRALVQKEVDTLDDRLTHVANLQEAYTKERMNLNVQAPQELVEEYETMKSRAPNPVVPVTREVCSGCFYGLSKPELVRAEHGELVICQSCHRMLYITKIAHDEE